MFHPELFLVTTSVQNWRHEDVFAKEPVHRMILALNSNTAYLGTNPTNPFNYQKFQLNERIDYRKDLLIAVTPASTTDNKRIYYITLESLDFFLTIAMKSVLLIITIIRLWHLITHLLRRLHMTSFIVTILRRDNFL